MTDMDIYDWHTRGADEKAESVVRLAPPGTKTVVEIGCGTGAVLAALDRRGFAEEYWACEPASALCEQVAARHIARLAALEAETFDSAFPGRTFDVAIISHVLEHLLSPAVLLAQALTRARAVIVEVPIEDNVLGRARSEVRAMLGRERTDNAAGHVQFFSRSTARALVRHAGGTVVAERAYFPYEAFKAQGDALRTRVVVASAKSEWLAQKYYEHFAMLTERSTTTEWQHHYFAPR